MVKPKKQRDETELEEDLELSPEQIRELKRRVKDMEDPVRYGKWCQILNCE